MTNGERVSQAMRAVSVASKAADHLSRRWFRWFFAPLCDDWRGLSLNRFLAILFGITATWGRFHGTALSGWDIAAMVVSGSLAFGKDVWVAYINRKKTEDAK